MNKLYIGDYEQCLQIANDFYRVSQSVVPDPFVGEGRTPYPYAVLIAFSCELYLKALAIKTGEKHEFQGTHDLYVLFHNLPYRVQERIRNNYSDSSYRDKLDSFLKVDKDVFVNWRYSFVNEQKFEELYYSDFQLFAEALRRTIPMYKE